MDYEDDADYVDGDLGDDTDADDSTTQKYNTPMQTLLAQLPLCLWISPALRARSSRHLEAPRWPLPIRSQGGALECNLILTSASN